MLLASKKKLTRDYRVKIQPGTFQKYRFFLYLYVGEGSNTPPPVYTFEVHVPVLCQQEFAKQHDDAAARKETMAGGPTRPVAAHFDLPQYGVGGKLEENRITICTV